MAPRQVSSDRDDRDGTKSEQRTLACPPPRTPFLRVQAFVDTEESEDRLRSVVEETEARCPVYNLLRDAGVNMEVAWVRRVPSSAARG